eukprot:TRINITY_DN4565_c0_g1_i1.p1 TRINITY_DN4565_c0_g1~~TRINITY_DN4565_c0_g1_i1.p1  ORF type:complete len:111 (+),score=22.86 TRINITY_DN4565_c0_g1_i1:353-685(+)
MNEHGDYEVINRILRVLSNGKSAKADVDEAIAACGDLYNMRHEMARCRLLLENAENDDEKELITYSTKNILSKYCTLIAFCRVFYIVLKSRIWVIWTSDLILKLIHSLDL